MTAVLLFTAYLSHKIALFLASCDDILDDVVLMDSEQEVATSRLAIGGSKERPGDKGWCAPRRSRRNPGIDFLRVLCTLYIVGFWHVADYVSSSRLHVNVVSRRVTCIILGTFVFISGYFIGLKGIDVNRRGVLAFYKRRVLRVYPLYIIAILAFAVLGLCGTEVSVKAALCISMIVGPPPRTLWFITLLMMFYLIAPWVVIALQRMSLARLFLYCLLFLFCVAVYEFITGMADLRIVMYFPSFVLGIVCACGMGPGIPRPGIRYVCVVLSALLSFVPAPYGRLLWTPMITLWSFLVFMVWRDSRVLSDRVLRIVALLSYCSYGMYLFHRPVYEILMEVYTPEHVAFRLFYLILLGLPLVVVTSFAVQKLYDIILGWPKMLHIHP